MESVCFTGACPNMTRDELSAKASAKFEVKSSATKDLNILVCADPNSGSSKLEKAKKNGTKIISYEDFLKMLDSDDDVVLEHGLSFFEKLAFKFEKVPYSKKASIRILDEVKKRTQIDAVKLWADYVAEDDDEPLELTESKLGGYPYWLKGKEYPKAKDDETPLVLLAQINFAKMPPLPDFPTKGILQFFVKPDSHYGCEFFNLNDDRWRCVYHEEIAEPMSVEELKALGVKSAAELDAKKEEYFPLQAEFLLTFEKTQVSMSSACEGRFESVIREVAKDFGLKEADEALDACNILDEDALESYWDNCEQGSKISGYPAFTQEDPRKVDDGYDVLLLQIDSEWQGEDNPKAQIMWGDTGVANFFIKREDLKKRDFSKVLYNWDCY